MSNLEVINVEQLDTHTLKITFNDSHISTINFLPYITNNKNEMVRDYIDSKLFNSYELVNGNVNWNDFDLIFAVEDLYKAEIFK